MSVHLLPVAPSLRELRKLTCLHRFGLGAFNGRGLSRRILNELLILTLYIYFFLPCTLTFFERPKFETALLNSSLSSSSISQTGGGICIANRRHRCCIKHASSHDRLRRAFAYRGRPSLVDTSGPIDSIGTIL